MFSGGTWREPLWLITWLHLTHKVHKICHLIVFTVYKYSLFKVKIVVYTGEKWRYTIWMIVRFTYAILSTLNSKSFTLVFVVTKNWLLKEVLISSFENVILKKHCENSISQWMMLKSFQILNRVEWNSHCRHYQISLWKLLS